MGEMPVYLSIHRNRIDVDMVYDRDDLYAIQAIPGRTWQKSRRMNTVPLDLQTCHLLRQAFGNRIVIGDELRSWAANETTVQRNLGHLASASTAELRRLPDLNLPLYEAVHLGPKGKRMTAAERRAALRGEPCFQAADVAFMAESSAPLNANQPGMGKTIETIASIFEQGTHEDGPQLIVAPISSLGSVWGFELNKWQDFPVFVANGTPAERKQTLDQALKMIGAQEPCWVVVNQHQISARNPHPIFLAQNWQNIVLDEAHKAGFGKPKNSSYIAMKRLGAMKRMMLTGTPMGGKPVNLFNLLQFLRPDVFTSKWSWGMRWLHVIENEYGKKFCNGFVDGGYKCPFCEGGILPATKEEFYRSLAPYLLRRLKSEEMKWLPDKMYIDRWVEMTAAQARIYHQFEAESFVHLEDGEDSTAVAGTGVLDTFTRLRQFAVARSTKVDGQIVPQPDSGKLAALLEILDERGIQGNDSFGEEKVIIFSQFERVISMLMEVLKDEGIAALRLTGKETGRARDATTAAFQAPGGARVLCMTTTAGGVSITLDRADTVVFMDQTWNPDNEEQAEDRTHRGDKTSQVMVYYIRSKGTIEEDVFDQATGKQSTNFSVLDLRRGIEARVRT